MSDYLEVSKKAWSCASGFPINKEDVYPEHKLVQEFDLHHNKKIYEYGCGNGSDVRSYLKRGNHVIATDIVPGNLETARKYNLEAGFTEDQFNFVLLEDSYPLPFDDESFDVISSHGVLHHIKNVDPVIKELYRVCKTGGSIYVMLYTDYLWATHWPTMQVYMKNHHIDQYEAFCWCTDGQGTPYARCYTTEEACAFLSDVGFKVIDYNHWLNDLFITVKGEK